MLFDAHWKVAIKTLVDGMCRCRCSAAEFSLALLAERKTISNRREVGVGLPAATDNWISGCVLGGKFNRITLAN